MLGRSEKGAGEMWCLRPVELLLRKTKGKNSEGCPRCKEGDGGYGKAQDSQSSPENGGFSGGLRRSGEQLVTAWGQDGEGKHGEMGRRLVGIK